MTTFNITLNDEFVDNIVVQSLSQSLENFKSDLGAGNNVFFWKEPEADDAEIQKHIDALELILRWYATTEQLKTLGLDN